MSNLETEIAAEYGVEVDEEAAGIAEPWNTEEGGVGPINFVSEWTGRIVAWLVLPLMAVLVFEVVSRKIFNSPTNWANDVAYMIYATHFLLGAAYTLKKNGHIRTDFVYRNWGVKRQAGVDAIVYALLFIPVLAIAVKVSWDFAWKAVQQGEKVTGNSRLPFWPLKLMLPIGLGLWLLQSISELVKSVRAVIEGRWRQHDDDERDLDDSVDDAASATVPGDVATDSSGAESPDTANGVD